MEVRTSGEAYARGRESGRRSQAGLGGVHTETVADGASVSTLEGIVTGVIVVLSFAGIAVAAVVRRAAHRIPPDLDPRHTGSTGSRADED